MKSLIVATALACLALSSSQAGAWMHGGGWGHHGGWNHGGWGHHGWGWGHHYGWHHGGWGGACRLNCHHGRCWRVCWG